MILNLNTNTINSKIFSKRWRKSYCNNYLPLSFCHFQKRSAYNLEVNLWKIINFAKFEGMFIKKPSTFCSATIDAKSSAFALQNTLAGYIWNSTIAVYWYRIPYSMKISVIHCLISSVWSRFLKYLRFSLSVKYTIWGKKKILFSWIKKNINNIKIFWSFVKKFIEIKMNVFGEDLWFLYLLLNL